MARPIQTSGTKTCTSCGVRKDITAFYLRGGKKSPNSRKAKCKECDKARVKANHDPDRARSGHLRRTYALTTEEFDALHLIQKGKCAICATEDPCNRWQRFAVDHDHTTGVVRGLLCHPCNTALGLVGDNVSTLYAMIKYLGG